MAHPHHLILGGQRSGKSRRAERLAAAWLDTPGHEALLVATASAGDDEMADRIAQHRADRARRVPRLATVEEPLALAEAVRAHAAPHRLVVVDCLTLWLTNLLMPLSGPATDADVAVDGLDRAVRGAAGPVVLVSNEIGLGLTPMGREARAFVDALGRCHQRMAACCADVTLMVAGLDVAVKRGSTGP